MKNNTTSTDNRYTIQPLTTCIDIKTERRLIACWHTSGLTDTQIRKMLMLYFGEPAWMNQQKLYDSYRFKDIVEGLRFHSRHDFVEILLRCTGFGFIWKMMRSLIPTRISWRFTLLSGMSATRKIWETTPI